MSAGNAARQHPLWALVLWALLFLLPVVAKAAATTIAVSGDVTMQPKSGATGQLAEGQRVESGATIKTAANGSMTLRFDDGQLTALSANTTYVINEYRFNAHKPEEGGVVSTLLRGGLRTVTGLIGKLNPGEVLVKTSVATIGIRGTDYQLFLDSRLHVHVLDGTIGVRNQGGEQLFSPNTEPTGIAASQTDRPMPVRFSELPADAQGAFRQLEANPIVGGKPANPSDPTCSDRR
jgi:hypothetical protein